MEQGNWLHTDEVTDFVQDLEIANTLADLVSNGDLHLWKWVIVTLHSCLQGAMVCALKGSNLLNLVKPAHARKWMEQWDQGETPPPIEWLDSFPSLYEKTKGERMLMYTTSEKLTPTDSQDASVARLNGLRNEFIHFVPRGWSIEVSGLPALALDCLEVIGFLAFESDNVLWMDEGLRRRCEQGIQMLAATLAKLAHCQNTRFDKAAGTVYNVPQMNKSEYTSTELATIAETNGRPVTARYIARLCQQGRILARKVGTGVRAVWLMPAEDAQRWLDQWLAKSRPTALG